MMKTLENKICNDSPRLNLHGREAVVHLPDEIKGVNTKALSTGRGWRTPILRRKFIGGKSLPQILRMTGCLVTSSCLVTSCFLLASCSPERISIQEELH